MQMNLEDDKLATVETGEVLVDTNNVAIYMFNDDYLSQVQITPENVTFQGQPVEDTTLNHSNCQLVDVGDTSPADWIGRKYCYSNNTWTENPNDPMKV